MGIVILRNMSEINGLQKFLASIFSPGHWKEKNFSYYLIELEI